MTDGDWLLRARGIARRFGAAQALEPADLDLRAGETVALIGPKHAARLFTAALFDVSPWRRFVVEALWPVRLGAGSSSSGGSDPVKKCQRRARAYSSQG